jgi:hypothetical protein
MKNSETLDFTRAKLAATKKHKPKYKRPPWSLIMSIILSFLPLVAAGVEIDPNDLLQGHGYFHTHQSVEDMATKLRLVSPKGQYNIAIDNSALKMEKPDSAD